jgi:hypothetical protein
LALFVLKKIDNPKIFLVMPELAEEDRILKASRPCFFVSAIDWLDGQQDTPQKFLE